MRASQGPEVDPQRFLDMAEAVTTQLLAAEPPRDHDDVVPKTFPFKHAKNDNAGSGLAVVVLDQLITADEFPRIMRGLSEFLVTLQFSHGGPRLINRALWPARDRILRTIIGSGVVKKEHAARASCPLRDELRCSSA